MFRLYFRNSNGENSFLADCDDMKEVNSIINKYLDERKINSSYRRMWFSAPGHLKIDFGSYSEFFVVKGEDTDWLLPFLFDDEE